MVGKRYRHYNGNIYDYDISWDGAFPIIYEYIKEGDIKGEIHLLNNSKTLHEVAPFSSWFIDPEELQEYVLQIKEAKESRIVLSSYQRDERINTIYKDALEKLFPEDKRLLWKRRLEEMAYILIQTDREGDAKMALSAAIDLKNPLSPIEPNPFIWELLIKSLYSKLEEDYNEEEEKEKSSLIIKR